MTGAHMPVKQPYSLESLESSAYIAIINMQTEIARCGVDLGQVLTLVCEHVAKLTRCSTALIELTDGEQMISRASAGDLAHLLGLRLSIDGSLSGLCVKTGSPMVCNDALADPRVNQTFCLLAGIRSMVMVPLIHNANTVGVLRIASEQPYFFTAREIGILELVSGVVAAAMYYASQYSTDELYHRATHDPLTDLPNRAFFFERLRFVQAQASRNNSKFALLNIDMDGLKGINDGLGHRFGDAAIQELARRLRHSIRHSDFAARLGGDEFAVILGAINDIAGVERKVRSIQDRLAQRFDFEGVRIQLQASIGIALFPEHGSNVPQIIESADNDMYAKKRLRKNTVFT